MLLRHCCRAFSSLMIFDATLMRCRRHAISLLLLGAARHALRCHTRHAMPLVDTLFSRHAAS